MACTCEPGLPSHNRYGSRSRALGSIALFAILATVLGCHDTAPAVAEVVLEVDGLPLHLVPAGIQPVARRDSTLRFRVDTVDAPPSLRVRADMPSMSHGPQETTLTPSRIGDGWELSGSLVFVMGGTWELQFLDFEGTLLGSHRIEVAEP